MTGPLIVAADRTPNLGATNGVHVHRVAATLCLNEWVKIPEWHMTPTQQQLDSMWQAVATRDGIADGRFVYAVVTTGIYCRPSCPARRPRRDNVRFFTSCVDAEQAGFRACKRCRPEGAADPRVAVVAAACRTIEASLTPPKLAELATAAGMSRFHFQRLFREVAGVTPRAYAAAHRGARVRTTLAAGAGVTEALYDAGFSSPGRFYAASGELLGMSPSAFRRGGNGETVRFAVGECSLGAILVAATDKGICAISLGDDPDTLVREMCDQFHSAELVGADERFEGHVAAVIGLVENPEHGLGLPLDIRGSAFQQQVWQALRDIPPGTTASYAEIAERLGRPGSARAVARACASNCLAIAIPCHRVVRSDGDLSGYRWGVERKRRLLERERSDDHS